MFVLQHKNDNIIMNFETSKGNARFEYGTFMTEDEAQANELVKIKGVRLLTKEEPVPTKKRKYTVRSGGRGSGE